MPGQVFPIQKACGETRGPADGQMQLDEALELEVNDIDITLTEPPSPGALRRRIMLCGLQDELKRAAQHEQGRKAGRRSKR